MATNSAGNSFINSYTSSGYYITRIIVLINAVLLLQLNYTVQLLIMLNEILRIKY